MVTASLSADGTEMATALLGSVMWKALLFSWSRLNDCNDFRRYSSIEWFKRIHKSGYLRYFMSENSIWNDKDLKDDNFLMNLALGHRYMSVDRWPCWRYLGRRKI